MIPGNLAPLLILGFLVLLGVGVWYFIRYYNTNYLLHLSVAVENPEVARGENLKFKVTVTPSRDVAVSRMVTRLRCMESETGQRYGENDWGYNRQDALTWFLNQASGQVVEEYEGEIPGGATMFRAGAPQDFEGEFPVPGDARHTKLQGNLRVHWYLIVEARLPSPPSAMAAREFQVMEKFSTAPEVTGDASSLFAPKPKAQPPQNALDGSFSHLELDPGKNKDGSNE